MVACEGVKTMLRLILHAKQTQLLCVLKVHQAEPCVAGTWGVRTRAITANSAGKLEWVERLILELKGPMVPHNSTADIMLCMCFVCSSQSRQPVLTTVPRPMSLLIGLA